MMAMGPAAPGRVKRGFHTSFYIFHVYYKIMKYLEIKKFVQKEFKFKNKSLKV